MPAANDFEIHWLIAFVALGGAVLLLKLFYFLIDSDLELLSLSKEALLAGIASAAFGAGSWLMSSLPGQARTGTGHVMLIPALVVLFLYKLAHLRGWSTMEFVLLFLFQFGLWIIIALMLAGQFRAGFATITLCAASYAVMAVMARSVEG